MRFCCIAAFAGLLFFVPQKSMAQTISYVKKSTVKIEQLVGDYDRQRKAATTNLTDTRYQLEKTDLGVPFSHNGKTFVLFGDVGSVARDPIAYSTDTNPGDGFKLDFVASSNGHWKAINIPGITMGGYQVPLDGVSWKNIMYIYFCTDYDNTVGFSTRSIIAKSLDDGNTFTKLYDVSVSKFINLAAVKSKTGFGFPETAGRDVQLMFGSGKYRASNVYLSYQLADNIGVKQIKYFKGLVGGVPQWGTNEAGAVALFSQPCVGELSVSYNAFIKKWIMLYNCDNPRGINCRTADNAWGPWSAPLVIFEPWGDGGYCNFMHADWRTIVCDTVQDLNKNNEWGGEYGPYQFEDFAIGDSTQTTIYYTLSTWNPYTSILMKSKLKRTNIPQFEMVDVEASENKEGICSFTWESRNPEQIKLYIVEASNDGSAFEEMTDLNAAISQGHAQYYSTSIINNKKYQYFRIKAIDKDNNVFYSVPVLLSKKIISDNAAISFAPNPVNDYLKIFFSNNSTGRFSIEVKSL